MKTFSKRPTLGRLISTGALCAITFGLLPAFNFVPAAAQAPLDSSTEPVAYPVEDDQTVMQSPAIVMVENKPAKKAQSKKVKPTSPPKTFRVVTVRPVHEIKIVSEHPAQIELTAPVPANAPTSPQPLRVENVHLIPPAPSRPAQVRLSAPLTPAKATKPYSITLAAPTLAIVPADAAQAVPAPRASSQRLVPARPAQSGYKRTENTYRLAGVTKYKVALSRPLVANPAGSTNMSTSSQADPTASVSAVSTQSVTVNDQPARISTSLRSSNVRISTVNIQPARISVTTVPTQRVRITNQARAIAPTVNITTKPAGSASLRISTGSTVNVSTTNRINVSAVKPITVKPIKINSKISIKKSKKN